MSDTVSASAAIPLRLRIRDGDGYAEFRVEAEPHRTVLDLLERLRSGGSAVPAYRHSCHHGSCGTCGAVIDGAERLMCLTPLATLGPGPVRVEPLRGMDAVGDLATGDAARLTGSDQPTYRNKPRFFPMNDFLASVAWDRNGGDGNLDLLVVTRRGGPNNLELVGRGHGAFLFNTEGKLDVPGRNGKMRRASPAALAPADMYGDGSHEMLVLEEDGTLFQKDSPVYVVGSPIHRSKAN